jgi:hypothetical protein
MVRPPYLREPVTVPPRELIVSYRALAARYREMAAAESRSFAREGLLDLARQFEAAVGGILLIEALTDLES